MTLSTLIYVLMLGAAGALAGILVALARDDA